MIGRGHNENAVRLSMLADDAQRGLERVVAGEADAIEGWLAYGAALNEGRALFPGDLEFGQWVSENALCQLGTAEVDRHERAAAMWAAANADQFEEARAAGKARTVRGIHDKWKQIEAERENARADAERKAEEDRKRAEIEAARKEAVTLAKVEEEARKEVAAAETEQGRREAEAKAAEAAEAKAEVEKVAEVAEAELAASVETVTPEEAKERRALAKLTTDALIDEVLGLRAALAEAKAKAKAQKAEIEQMKEDLAAFKQDDIGRALGNAQRQARAAEGQMKEYQAIAVRADRRAKALEAENKKLRAEMENQVVPL
jgi:hypothetical protein